MPLTPDPYAHVARIYDPLLNPFLSRVRREITLACLHRGLTRVLDFGCGTGGQCILLHRHGLRVTGMDASVSMLAQAKRKSPGDITFVQAQATRAVFAPNTFDGVIMSFVLHENSPQIINNLMSQGLRVLKPGGTLFLLDYQTPDTLPQAVAHLGVACIERGAGLEHYRNYRRFLQSGGIGQLCAAQRDVRVSSSRPLFLNTAALISLQGLDLG